MCVCCGGPSPMPKPLLLGSYLIWGVELEQGIMEMMRLQGRRNFLWEVLETEWQKQSGINYLCVLSSPIEGLAQPQVCNMCHGWWMQQVVLLQHHTPILCAQCWHVFCLALEAGITDCWIYVFLRWVGRELAWFMAWNFWCFTVVKLKPPWLCLAPGERPGGWRHSDFWHSQGLLCGHRHFTQFCCACVCQGVK